MDTQSSSDDCYFYYYSSCTKGDDCPFRHCKAALGTETVCSLWREGRCYRDNCKFRHMESRIKRSAIPCYWENQPGGCRKPHCVFLHAKYRHNSNAVSENQALILPTSSQALTLTPNSAASNVTNETNPSNHSTTDSSLPSESLTVSASSQPVEPLVVSFDEGEESDAESVSSTPVKSAQVGRGAVKCATALFGPEDKDFGVKTLEQLRMEKIHRESEHFYKPDSGDKPHEVNRLSALHEDSDMFEYCSPHETMEMEHKSEPQIYNMGFYPPDSSDIIPLSINSSHDESMFISSSEDSPNDKPVSKQKDLRNKIAKILGGRITKVNPTVEKKTLSLKRTHEQTEEVTLDFKVKTLDEIRREKEKKTNENANPLSPPPPYELNDFNTNPETNKECSEVHNSENQRKIRKLFRDPFIAHKENRQVQKSFENNLKVGDAQKMQQNGSANGISIEDTCTKLTEPEPTKPDRPKTVISISSKTSLEGKISTRDTQVDAASITQNSKETTTKSSASEYVVSARKLRPIIRRKSNLISEPTNPTREETSSNVNSFTNNLLPEITPSSKEIPDSSICNSIDKTSDLTSIDLSQSNGQDVSNMEFNDSITSLSPAVHESVSVNDQLVEPAKRSTSVDEFDSLFLNDSEMMLDEAEDSNDKKAEDIFLEIEQMLES